MRTLARERTYGCVCRVVYISEAIPESKVYVKRAMRLFGGRIFDRINFGVFFKIKEGNVRGCMVRKDQPVQSRLW